MKGNIESKEQAEKILETKKKEWDRKGYYYGIEEFDDKSCHIWFSDPDEETSW